MRARFPIDVFLIIALPFVVLAISRLIVVAVRLSPRHAGSVFVGLLLVAASVLSGLIAWRHWRSSHARHLTNRSSQPLPGE
jgi:hypothetical protein